MFVIVLIESARRHATTAETLLFILFMAVVIGGFAWWMEHVRKEEAWREGRFDREVEARRKHNRWSS